MVHAYPFSVKVMSSQVGRPSAPPISTDLGSKRAEEVPEIRSTNCYMSWTKAKQLPSGVHGNDSTILSVLGWTTCRTISASSRVLSESSGRSTLA